MTATGTVSRQLAFHADDYLDSRQPGWEIYEAHGLVRVQREPGSKTALVLVDDDCVAVLEVLRARASRPTNTPR